MGKLYLLTCFFRFFDFVEDTSTRQIEEKDHFSLICAR